MSIPKRDDPKYIEIENFEPYELTNCIAYEMAIRNDEFIETKKELFELNKKLDNFLSLRSRNRQKEFDKIYPQIFQKMEIKWFTSMEEYNDLYLFIFKEYSDNKQIKYKTSYCEDIEKLQTIYTKKLKEAKEKFGLVIDKSILGLEKTISDKKKEQVESWVHGIETHTGKHIGLYPDQRHKIHGIKDEDNIRDSMSFTTLILSRPRLEFPSMKNTHIELNLALPPNELSAYILEIKRLYDLDQTMIATANEIFGNKNIVDDEAKDILINGYARADMFYIYDCLKLGYTQRRIQNKVYNYYHEIGENKRTLSDRALRKYRDIAKNMIDDKKFKNLMTGFKN